MLNLRHTLVAAVAAIALVPNGHAQAATGGEEAIGTLADDAAELLAEELALVEQSTSAGALSPAELEAVRAQLRSVDGRGQSLLVQLRGLGATVTPAIETALGRLPESNGASASSVSLFPQPVVYEAAIDDLARIAATPAAVAPGRGESDGPSYALLGVAAVSLVILGAAALTTSLWRRPEDDAMSWSDGLTGLASRRRLDHDIQTAAIEGPTSVIMIDVDHFQSVNESYGKHTGDDVLKRLGSVFEQHVRRDDVVYRYGGEEFCVLLPGADADEARLVADRIVAAAHDIELPNGTNITVSAGIARTTGNELGEAIEHADRAVDLARRQGRDRAVHADEQKLVGSS
jgi:diguanylate cyclase (GGDEF)-like protein